MSTRFVVMARSALPSTNKRNILVCEAVRRLVNCHPNLPNEEKAFHLNNFNLSMMDSGHNERFRRVVIARALAKYDDTRRQFEETGRPMYRTREERYRQKVESGGGDDKTTWYCKLGYNNTLTLPATLGGELSTKVKKALDDSQPPMGFRTLVLEDGGRPLKSDLVKTNPFPRMSCQRVDCLMCSRSPSKGKCSESSTVYRIRCNRSPCNDEESLEDPTYVGETSHTPYTRGAQHLCQYRARKDGSFMHKHMMEEHEGVMGGEG